MTVRDFCLSVPVASGWLCCVVYRMIHVIAHVLTLWAVASANRTASVAVETLHLLAESDFLTSAAVALIVMLAVDMHLNGRCRHMVVVLVYVVVC